MLGFLRQRVASYGAWLLIVSAVMACGQTPHTSVPPQTASDPEPTPAATAPPPPVAADAWLTFRNQEFRYAIDVPPDWTIDDTAKNEVIIFVGSSNGPAGLHILALDWSSTIDEFILENHRFHQRRAATYFEPLSNDEVQMGNGPTARRVAYRLQNEPRFCTELLLDYLLLAGKVSYALQGSICEGAEGLYGQDMEAMQRSFRLDSDRAMQRSSLRAHSQRPSK